MSVCTAYANNAQRAENITDMSKKLIIWGVGGMGKGPVRGSLPHRCTITPPQQYQ
jgi:hypothetical protein